MGPGAVAEQGLPTTVASTFLIQLPVNGPSLFASSLAYNLQISNISSPYEILLGKPAQKS